MTSAGADEVVGSIAPVHHERLCKLASNLTSGCDLVRETWVPTRPFAFRARDDGATLMKCGKNGVAVVDTREGY
jgi:hypothetical protein